MPDVYDKLSVTEVRNLLFSLSGLTVVCDFSGDEDIVAKPWSQP